MNKTKPNRIGKSKKLLKMIHLQGTTNIYIYIYILFSIYCLWSPVFMNPHPSWLLTALITCVFIAAELSSSCTEGRGNRKHSPVPCRRWKWRNVFPCYFTKIHVHISYQSSSLTRFLPYHSTPSTEKVYFYIHYWVQLKPFTFLKAQLAAERKHIHIHILTEKKKEKQNKTFFLLLPLHLRSPDNILFSKLTRG